MIPSDTALVDWSQGQLLTVPRKKRPEQRQMCYPVKCVRCEKVRWLTKADALKAEAEQRMCKRCQTSDAGKLGYAATVERHGENFALQHVLKRQLQNPSPYEYIVAQWLLEMGIPYDTQIPFAAADPSGHVHTFLLDIVMITPTQRIVLEVNGWFHRRYRAERDRWLSTLYPGQVVLLSTEFINKHPSDCKAKLRALWDERA
jgi:hypothetical protein